MGQQTKQERTPFHLSLSKQVAEQIRRGTSSWLVPHKNEDKSMPYNPIKEQEIKPSEEKQNNNIKDYFEIEIVNYEKKEKITITDFDDLEQYVATTNNTFFEINDFINSLENSTGITGVPELEEQIKEDLENAFLERDNGFQYVISSNDNNDIVYLAGENLKEVLTSIAENEFAIKRLHIQSMNIHDLSQKEQEIEQNTEQTKVPGQTQKEWKKMILLDIPYEDKEEAKALGAKWSKNKSSWYVLEGTNLEPFAKWTKEEQSQSIDTIAEKKTFLAVPYTDKEKAKKLGAKWDQDNKSWFVEANTNLEQFSKWVIDEKTITPRKQETISPEIEFTEHLRSMGFDVDHAIMDGQIHRVTLIGKPQGKDGAYCGFLDGVPNGWTQNYVTGEKSKFIASGVKLTAEEKAQQQAEFAQKQQEREEKRKLEHDKVAKKAVEIMMYAKKTGAEEHNYIKNKGIQPYNALQNDKGQLVISIENINSGETRGLQFINEDGTKQFLSGMEKKGNFAFLNTENKDFSKVLLCEGYATGSSLHEATKLPVAIAFDAGNLEPVAQAIYNKCKSEIIICADNDQYKDINVGLEKAQEAAKAVNGKICVPMFTSKEKEQKLTDFNDLHQSQGLDAVRKQLGFAKSLTQTVAQQQTKKTQLTR